MHAMQQYPRLFQPLMCFTPVKLTAVEMEHMFTPCLSDPGSNQRNAENGVYAWWLDYLQDVEGNDLCKQQTH